MKLVAITFLEGDERCVERLLDRLRVPRWSELAIEGHSKGTEIGWYGEEAPFRSRMIFTFVNAQTASELLDAVRECTGVEDPRHPIRAFELAVEASAACGCPAEEEE